MKNAKPIGTLPDGHFKLSKKTYPSIKEEKESMAVILTPLQSGV